MIRSCLGLEKIDLRKTAFTLLNTFGGFHYSANCKLRRFFGSHAHSHISIFGRVRFAKVPIAHAPYFNTFIPDIYAIISYPTPNFSCQEEKYTPNFSCQKEKYFAMLF